MEGRYKAEPWGGTWAVFRTDDVDLESPLVIVWDKDGARDLCMVMNWAAADRKRHAPPCSADTPI